MIWHHVLVTGNLWLSYKKEEVALLIPSCYFLTWTKNQLWSIDLICQSIFYVVFWRPKCILLLPTENSSWDLWCFQTLRCTFWTELNYNHKLPQKMEGKTKYTCLCGVCISPFFSNFSVSVPYSYKLTKMKMLSIYFQKYICLMVCVFVHAWVRACACHLIPNLPSWGMERGVPPSPVLSPYHISLDFQPHSPTFTMAVFL